MFAGPVPFVLQHRIKAHARIIWGASWTWDSRFFATASRDGTVKVWSMKGLSSTSKPVTVITLGQKITAIAFAHHDDAAGTAEEALSSQYKLALGLETGTLSVWQIQHTTDEVLSSCCWQSALATSHCAPVRKLCWQTNTAKRIDRHPQHSQTRLATCADDHCIRIFNLSETAM